MIRARPLTRLKYAELRDNAFERRAWGEEIQMEFRVDAFPRMMEPGPRFAILPNCVIPKTPRPHSGARDLACSGTAVGGCSSVTDRAKGTCYKGRCDPREISHWLKYAELRDDAFRVER